MRITPANLVLQVRAAAWTVRAARAVRNAVKSDLLTANHGLPEPPGAGMHSFWAMRATLRATRTSCLPRSLVEQRWLASRGLDRDVIIGVAGGRRDFAAHAWVDGEEDGAGYAEITRIPPPATPGRGSSPPPDAPGASPRRSRPSGSGTPAPPA